jgi:hypothetical protein
MTVNRLEQSTSAYLLQHAHNPVHWFEWGEEALALAKGRDVPILLSIGYAACHWCHVMAHESFEDAATAEVMNRLFLNIKVDREQRPDLDKVYQLSHQMLTQRGGGWPLTVFLDPADLTAFFAGTYFPKDARYGLPPFVQILEGARKWFDGDRKAVRQQSERLREVLAEVYRGQPPREQTSLRAMDTALRAWEQNFDVRYGGFGQEPKFPHPVELSLIAAQVLPSPNDAQHGLRGKLLQTLDAMAQGGLQDHLAGGFFRYSVDARWDIPHFEKMLYDNALLLPLYAQAAAWTGRADYAAVAAGVVGFLRTDLQGADGTFGSSLDADTEGQEGKFYVWTRMEVEAALDPADVALAIQAFGLDLPANFEQQFWHLQRRVSLESLALASASDPVQLQLRLTDMCQRLLSQRMKRVRPALDDKCLCSWNALAISGLVRAGVALQRPEWIAMAQQAYVALREQLWVSGRGWLSCSRAGRAELSPFLDDLAFLLDAQLQLLGSAGDVALLNDAIDVADVLLNEFSDPAGGFYFTAHHAQALPARPKTFSDEATPSGNGVAIRALTQLGRLLGEPRYLIAASAALNAAGGELQRHPDGCASVLSGLHEQLAAPIEVVWRGPLSAISLWQAALDAVVQNRWHRYVLLDAATDYPGALQALPSAPHGRAYLCRAGACELPLDNPAALLARCAANQ